MEPKFPLGTQLLFTATHAPYRIGFVEEIIEIDGVTHYACNFEGHSDGFFPEHELKEL